MLVEMYPETGVIDFKQFGEICMLLTFLWWLKLLSLHFTVLISELWSISVRWKNIWQGRAITFVISCCCYLWNGWCHPACVTKPSDVSKWCIISLCSDRCLQIQKRVNIILCEAYLFAQAQNMGMSILICKTFDQLSWNLAKTLLV